MKAQPQTQTSHHLTLEKNICVDFMKAYQEQHIDQMISLCDPLSTVSFGPLGDEGKGKIHELGRGLWTMLTECFPNLDNTVHSLVAEEGKIKCIVSIRGTQVKDFAGIINKGCTFDSEHIFVFELDEVQKIKHLDIQWDHPDFVKQLSK